MKRFQVNSPDPNLSGNRASIYKASTRCSSNEKELVLKAGRSVLSLVTSDDQCLRWRENFRCCDRNAAWFVWTSHVEKTALIRRGIFISGSKKLLQMLKATRPLPSEQVLLQKLCGDHFRIFLETVSQEQKALWGTRSPHERFLLHVVHRLYMLYETVKSTLSGNKSRFMLSRFMFVRFISHPDHIEHMTLSCPHKRTLFIRVTSNHLLSH